ncbi:MAG: HDIG domain-containing protein [Clostridiales bacterium]|jgi:putative nucleotidyltransferase with HDIG domain|nr:HDIG domain-containing protein [Clostridiales bacterium]
MEHSYKRIRIFYGLLFFAACTAVIAAAAVLRFVFITGRGLGAAALAPLTVAPVMLMAALCVYMIYTRKELFAASRRSLYAIITAVTLSYTANIYLALPSPLLMPSCMAAFVIAPISKRRDAFVGNLFANLLVFSTLIAEYIYGASDSLYEFFIVFLLGVTSGTVASYILSSDAKRAGLIIKGFIINTSVFALTLMLCLLRRSDAELAALTGFAAVGAYIPVIFAPPLQPLLEKIFNLVTNSRLIELTDHNSPLIKRLRLETPGTFNHSLAVANFAEICASSIGENPYLARACAYYHDVGKLVNPSYFKENQSDLNPHDELLPEVSAEIIRSHTTEGLALCRRYRIPKTVADVTVQHHGTLLIPVFYNKACKLTDGEVDKTEYSYRGVTPVTKIAAIIMLCDAGEAAIRAIPEPDGEKVDRVLTALIRDRIEARQFDNCDISLRDLDTVKRAIISAYGGLFHKRMEYPDTKSAYPAQKDR